MTRTPLFGLMSLFLTFVSVANSVGASITYNIQSYAALQNGYTLTGTITTDGTLGVLTSDDITAWNYTITNGTTTDQESGTGADAQIKGLTATSTQLTLPFPDPTQSDYLSLLGRNTNGVLSGLVYVNFGIDSNNNEPDFYYATISSPPTSGFAWSTTAPVPPGLSLGGSTWIIAQASVPEPGSLTLVLLGSACLAAVQWTRRCRRVASGSQASPTVRP